MLLYSLRYGAPVELKATIHCDGGLFLMGLLDGDI